MTACSAQYPNLNMPSAPNEGPGRSAGCFRGSEAQSQGHGGISATRLTVVDQGMNTAALDKQGEPFATRASGVGKNCERRSQPAGLQRGPCEPSSARVWLGVCVWGGGHTAMKRAPSRKPHDATTATRMEEG